MRTFIDSKDIEQEIEDYEKEYEEIKIKLIEIRYNLEELKRDLKWTIAFFLFTILLISYLYIISS